MPPAIRADDLGKCYRLQQLGNEPSGGGYRTLRDDLMSLARAPWRRLRSRRGGENGDGAVAAPDREFWAIKDVRFEVPHGEAVGIIGRNGAGKSTLLKVLSRITRPTTGRVEIVGRVSSLLEVGTGFHPELTGRENIALNGSILGMSRREIARQFDEIVDFSGVGPFLDLPVKRYSSGMQVRLAFAVGAHLQPDVLIVDEVLAVGDFEFQKRCLGKMGDAVKSGRTVLFVSHNLDAVARLTTRALLLQAGRVVQDGPSAEVIRTYLAAGGGVQARWRAESFDPTKQVQIRSVDITNGDGRIQSHFDATEPIHVLIEFHAAARTLCQVAFRLYSGLDGQVILTSATGDPYNRKSLWMAAGSHRARCIIPANLLRPGTYSLQVAANKPPGGQFDLIEQTASFEVTPVGSLTNHDRRLGVIAPLLDWQTDRLESADTDSQCLSAR